MKFHHFILLAVLLLPMGCVSPIVVDSKKQPELSAIRAEFSAIVARAHEDEDVEWVSGWAGNSAIKETGEDGSMMGYCYEWQELVYEEIASCVRAQGWNLVKININRDWFSEHHAVVVFDEALISQEELLTKTGPGAYVLDAWQRGHADVFTLENWLSIPVIVFETAALELEPGVHWHP